MSSDATFAIALLLLKVWQTIWDTIGLLLFQKLVCLLFVLPFLPERRSEKLRIFPSLPQGALFAADFKPASFVSRLLASGIDALLFCFPAALIYFGILFATALVIDPVLLTAIQISTNLFLVLAPAAVAAVFESSRLQASPGKLLFRIKVCDINGNRCSFARALARNLAFVLSDLSFGIGYLTCFRSERRQCTQDGIANCLVLKR